MLLTNEEGNILAHTLHKATMPPEHRDKLGGLDQAYVLMRESLEEGESLEKAAHRGIAEEFGATGTIVRFLGSTQSILPESYGSFEKTTLYFHMRLTEQGERPKNDGESHTEITWVAPDVLLSAMKTQGQSTSRGDLDESKIVNAYVGYR